MSAKDYFLRALRNELTSLSLPKQEQVIQEYIAFFAQKTSEGKSEEEIIRELGDPKKIAAKHIEENKSYSNQQEEYYYRPTTARNQTKFIIFLILDIFVFLPLIVGLFSAIAGIAAVSFGLIIASPVMMGLAGATLGIGALTVILTIALFVLFISLMIKLIIVIIKGISRHISWMSALYGGRVQ